MLTELKFVQGAVAKKDLMPAMTHFRIEKGFVRSYNGVLALCSPIALDFDCIPKAEPMVKAIAQCNEPPLLQMTANGRLRIQSGPFKVFIDCVEGDTPHVEPAGEVVNFDGAALLKALELLITFTGDDASRPWTNGILLKDQSAFATNNVVLIEYWLGVPIPFTVNIPRQAVREILRIGTPPTHGQIDANSLTLHYEGGRWLRTQLLDAGWPDLGRILNAPHNATPVDPQLFEALERLKDFADDAGRVYVKDGVLRTHVNLVGEDKMSPTDVEEGATYTLSGLGFQGAYQIKMLSLIGGVATHADFTRFPEPTLFFGDRLRGAIIGMRM